jgi:hypothetical protein
LGTKPAAPAPATANEGTKPAAPAPAAAAIPLPYLKYFKKLSSRSTIRTMKFPATTFKVVQATATMKAMSWLGVSTVHKAITCSDQAQ